VVHLPLGKGCQTTGKQGEGNRRESETGGQPYTEQGITERL